MNRHRFRSEFAACKPQSVSFAESSRKYHCSMASRVTLRDLFPNETEEGLGRIAEFLHGYCAVVWRIFERLEQEHPEIIDELLKARSMKGKVDSSNKHN